MYSGRGRPCEDAPRCGCCSARVDAESPESRQAWHLAASLSTLCQHPGDDFSRVKQDGPVFLGRELDEAQSPEKEHSFDGQQGMANVLGSAGLGQERIEQRAVIAPRWLHHLRSVYQRGDEKSRPASRCVVFVERLLDVGEDNLERLSGPTAESVLHRILKARHLSLQRRAKQRILGREGIDEAALADSCTLCHGIEREIAAPGLEDYLFGGIQNPIPIDFLSSRQNSPLLFRLASRITISD
jgi:hypothetical protein